MFIFLIYFLAANLLYLIGPVGPGLLYMLGASFFSIIIFPNRYSFYPSFINIVICALVACVIPYDLFPWHNAPEHSVWLWIAVTSNLIFLSLVSAALIPRVFNSLERALRKEQEMRIERDQQNQLLEATLKELKQKNKDLEQFALVASHDLQEPLRMITGFLTQLNKKYGHQLDATAHQYIDFASDGKSPAVLRSGAPHLLLGLHLFHDLGSCTDYFPDHFWNPGDSIPSDSLDYLGWVSINFGRKNWDELAGGV